MMTAVDSPARSVQCGELFETGTLVVAPQGALGIEIDGEQDRDQQSEKGKPSFQKRLSARVSNR